MDAADRAILQMLWDLVLTQRNLLNLMVPTCQAVARTLIEGNKPTPEQVSTWTEINSRVTQATFEVNAGIEKARSAIEPIIHYDA
jgi:hypothetical protein